MGYEIFITGENIDTTQYNQDNVIIKNNKCLITFDTKEEAQEAVRNINKTPGTRAFTLTDIGKTLDRIVSDYTPLENISYECLINNQFSKDEEFVVFNDGNFSLWGVNNEDVDSLYKQKAYGSIIVSCTGIFLANFYNDKLVCYATNFSKIFTDLYFESQISSVKFSRNDTYMVVYTQNKVNIIDTFKGRIILSKNKENVEIDSKEENIYFMTSCLIYRLANLTEELDFPVDLKILTSFEDQSLSFYEGKVQRIIYQSKKSTTKKTQANINSVNFGFTDKSGYAFITKQIKNTFLYTLEVYRDNTIFMINFENKLVDYKVSDKMVVTYDILRNVSIYSQEKSGYNKIKQIEKEGDVLVSISRSVVCLYDEISENLEFYEGGELQSVYPHRGCSELHWSRSGLYLSAISDLSGVLQLFNNNGKLLFKKVFNVFDRFIWRPFIKLSDEEKEKIKEYDLSKYIAELSISAASEYNLETLVSNWKSFLLRKKQLFSK
jgi:hypothetical protein